MLPQKAHGGQIPVLTLFESRFLSCSLLGTQASPKTSRGPFSWPPISPWDPGTTFFHHMSSLYVGHQAGSRTHRALPHPPALAFRSGPLNQAWWCMCVIPALGTEAGGLAWDYRERPTPNDNRKSLGTQLSFWSPGLEYRGPRFYPRTW